MTPDAMTPDATQLGPSLPATPSELFAGVSSASDQLCRWMAELTLTDEVVARPSHLPGWSNGHVLSHIARNADGVNRTLTGVLQGQVVARYPGGDAERNQAIADGAGRPAADIKSDVIDSARALAGVLAAVDAAGLWGLPSSEGRTAAEWLYRRWREIEIHRIDADLGYQPTEWTAAFIDVLLPGLVAEWDARVDETLIVRASETDSTSSMMAGREFTIAAATAPSDAAAPVTEVSGPDWALICWLTGRPTFTESLGDVPRLQWI